MPSPTRIALTAAMLGLAACGGPKPEAATPAPTPPVEIHPLASLLGQNIIVAPVQALRIPADLGWPELPANPGTLRRLDSLFADTLRARVGNQQWVFAEALMKSAANNPTYATDPRALAVNSLRSPALKISDRLAEPLASQLRTMIAFHDVRMVLIPTDLTIERVSAGIGRPTVRVVLVDPRSSIVRWIGRVAGPDTPAFTSDIPVSIAARLADLFAPR
jgi:hypothetical protein